MKVVILAGGRGIRLGAELSAQPKPLVDVGGKPIIWHIMSIYSQYGFNDFVVCLGHKGAQIREYFLNYHNHDADLTVDLGTHTVTRHAAPTLPWRVTLADTGLDTMTGGRLAAVRQYLDDEPFLMTYGDAVADVSIADLVEHHREAGKLVTVTAVRPSGRFGALELDGDSVTKFEEKPRGDSGYVNGGFFVIEPAALDLIASPETMWEHEPLEALAASGQLGAFRHDGYWQCMDTPRDREELVREFNAGAPWLQR